MLFNVKHGVYARMLRKLMEITLVRTQALHEFHLQRLLRVSVVMFDKVKRRMSEHSTKLFVCNSNVCRFHMYGQYPLGMCVCFCVSAQRV